MKIINKPWGKEEIIEINSKYMLKKLSMNKGHRCSLQYHNLKKETIFVLSGKLKILIGEKISDLRIRNLDKGDSITIEPGIIHRMEGIENVVYLEASTPETNDVVRLKDDYSRN